MEWVLFLIINSKQVDILQYKIERDCVNAMTAVRKSLKTVDSGTKIEARCEWRAIK